MKVFVFLTIFISTTCVSFSQWEKTSWQSDPIIKIAARDGDRLLLTGSGSLLRTDVVKLSTDEGESWKEITPINPIKGVKSAEIIGNTIILNFSYEGADLYISTDLGASWSNKFPGMTEGDTLLAFARNGEELLGSFKGEKNGVYKSTDVGITWTKMNSGLTTKTDVDFIKMGSLLFARTGQSLYYFSQEFQRWVYKGSTKKINEMVYTGEIKNTFYILTYMDEVFVSTDSCLSWKDFGANLPSSFKPRRLTIAGNSIILSSDVDVNSGAENQIFSSSDGGATWIERNNSLIKDKKFSIYSSNGKLFLGVEDSLFVSSDLGAHWSFVSNDLPNRSLDWRGLYFADSKIYNVIGNRIYISGDNGYTWKKWYGGINYFQVDDMQSMDGILYAVERNNPKISTFSNNLFASSDFGVTWKPLILEDNIVHRVFVGDKKLLANTMHGPYLSTDLGNTWVSVNEVWGDNTIFNYAVFLSDTIFTCSSFSGVKVSTNGGLVWNSINSGIPAAPYNILKNFKLVRGSDSFNVLYTMYDSLLYRSTNNGLDWFRIGEDLPDMGFQRSCMEANNNEAYVYTKSAIYYSSDFGETWVERTTGLALGENKWIGEIKIIDDLAFISVVDNQTQVTPDYGVYVSSDKGITWKQINGGISNFSYINTFAEAGDYVFCGSATGYSGPKGDAIYSAKISDLISAPEAAQAPSGMTIAPNPAGDFISISNYRGTDRRFTILNLLGQKVLSGELSGNGILVSSLLPGAYMIRIGNETGMMLKK